jgi:hypothetical protein
MQEIIIQLETLLNIYSGGLYNISAEEFSHKPKAEQWSKKEILGHLVDSAQNNIQRFIRAQYEDKPHIVYNQDVWVAAQAYQRYASGDLITLWQLLNKHICIILASMPADKYNMLCNTGKQEEELFTVKQLAEDYTKHLIHHLKQIIN